MTTTAVVHPVAIAIHGTKVKAYFLTTRQAPGRTELELRAQCEDGRLRTIRGTVGDFRTLRDTIGTALEAELDGRSLE